MIFNGVLFFIISFCFFFFLGEGTLHVWCASLQTQQIANLSTDLRITEISVQAMIQRHHNIRDM